MLTKKQLEDMSNNSVSWNLKDAAQTALAYRTMLERLEWSGVHRETGIYMCPICEALCSDKHKPDCELAKLLKESEVEHDAML